VALPAGVAVPAIPASQHRSITDAAPVAMPADVAVPDIPGIAASRHYLTQPVWRC
jgi:hypothetical protein